MFLRIYDKHSCQNKPQHTMDPFLYFGEDEFESDEPTQTPDTMAISTSDTQDTASMISPNTESFCR